jgi:hypothetical protein
MVDRELIGPHGPTCRQDSAMLVGLLKGLELLSPFPDYTFAKQRQKNALEFKSPIRPSIRSLINAAWFNAFWTCIPVRFLPLAQLHVFAPSHNSARKAILAVEL